MPASLVFREASSRDVFLSIARFAGISLGFDPAFRDAPVTVDLRNASLDDALSSVADATRTFFRVTAPRTVLVIPDTPAKRREYEEEVVRTFYLSNADLKETMDLLRMVLDARRISPTTATNALTIKDTPERDCRGGARAHGHRQGEARGHHRRRAARGRSRRGCGVRAAVRLAGLARASTARSASPADGSQTLTLRRAAQPVAGGRAAREPAGALLPAAQDRHATRERSPTRSSERRRACRRRRASASACRCRSTTFAPIATGGTPQQPITSFNYENIGVNIDITPRTHHDDDVTLALKVRGAEHFRRPASAACRRSATAKSTPSIRLRDGETNMLAGLIRDEERRVAGRHSRPERHPGRRPPVRAHADRDESDRHHPDADAAHRPRARSGRSRSAARSASAAIRVAPASDLPVADRRCRARAEAAGRSSPAEPAAARTCRAGRCPANADRRQARATTRVASLDLLDRRAERLQPLDQLRVAALDGLERRQPALARPPPAPRQSAPSPTAGRGCRAAGPAACVGPVTMIRCGSQRNRSAPMPLNCSSANSRSSYSQSWTSVRPSACVASTVTRLTRSLGNPGHRPVVMRPAAIGRRPLDAEDVAVDRALDVHAA